MSNYPPQPGYPQQPGYPSQPGGYGGYPAITKTSGAAIAALICGLIICFPLTSLAAILLGLIGFINAGKPGMKGRGLAVAGLLLGLIGLGGQIAAGVYFYNFMAPIVKIAQEMQTLPQHQDFTRLAKYSDVPMERWQQLTDDCKAHGGIKNVHINQQNRNSSNGQSNGLIDGNLTLGDGTTAPFQVQLGFDGKSFKITDVEVDFTGSATLSPKK
ncbi:MAG: hypothetical protein QM770_24625 [Tepidisphaeraceae bacterium]